MLDEIIISFARQMSFFRQIWIECHRLQDGELVNTFFERSLS